MVIKKTINDSKLNIELEGRLDTNTAPKLEEELKDCLTGVSSICFDLKQLEYVSSAGLRVFLATHKKMSKQNSTMIIRNVNQDVMDIFEVTGFAEILNIENEG